jgi:ParB family transcriptional regulator, chromosome partitioning protein
MAEKPKRLGRGLEALFSAAKTAGVAADRGGAAVAEEERELVRRVPIAQIRPNPYQPRREFRPEELADLEASLRTSGLLQPISVRPATTGSGYELIAGERRLRAATRIGWTEIPATVREIDDRTMLTLALVENLQRSDLNPLEEAEGYQRLIDEFGATQQQVADLVGKDRSTVANSVRLLHLPASVRRLVQDGSLATGHARALLSLGDERRMTELAREATAKGLTVRDVEARVRAAAPERARPKKARKGAAPGSAEARRIQDQLRRRLQTDVEITLAGNERGTIGIAFYSFDDLERILDLIAGDRDRV